MSDKTRKKEDSYFAARRRKQRRTMMIIVPIIAAVIAIGIGTGIYYYATAPKPIDTSGFGPLGSEHEHAVFLVNLDGKLIDFNQSKYKVKSNYIHVEGNDGTTLHRHATNVPINAFFQSVNMNVTDSCFKSDDGRTYCNEGDKQLRLYLNGDEEENLAGYVLDEGDRFLIIYGNQTGIEIDQVLDQLRQIEIKG